MSSNFLGTLGLARKAGLLEIGDECVRLAAQSKKARLVLLASDASERTRETFFFICGDAQVPCVEIAQTREELGNAIGKRPCATVAICDTGLAAAIIKKLAEENDMAKELLPIFKKKADRVAERRNKAKNRKTQTRK